MPANTTTSALRPRKDGTNDFQFRYSAVAPPNVAATGQPAISGTAQVGETLTAGTAGIADDNGLSNAAFTYQWIRTADGASTDIPGASSSTYLLTEADLDHTITVQVDFNDDACHAASITSNATGAVTNPPNISPSGLPTILGNAAVGKTLGAQTTGITDGNGLTNVTFTYQWARSADGTDTDVPGATGKIFKLTHDEAGHTITVRVSFTDDDGFDETVTSQATQAVPGRSSDDGQADTITPRADADVTLVDNYSESASSVGSLAAFDQAQQFTTGPHSGGYSLKSVTFHFQTTFSNTDASVRETNASGQPGSTVGTLGAPTTTGYQYTFSNSSGIDLDPYKSYFVVLDAASNGSGNIGNTSSNDQDSDYNWTIANNSWYRDEDSTGGWTEFNDAKRMTIVGAPNTGQVEHTVPNNWGLIPADLGGGDSFRLIFLSSTKRNAAPTGIEDYNTFVQDRAAAGHSAIQAYSSHFRVLGSTEDIDARDNTETTGTGVPIYWLDGNKVADDYADFYDGDWDDEANDKNESGDNGLDTSLNGNLPFTGSDHDGTGDDFQGNSLALGSTYSVSLVLQPHINSGVLPTSFVMGPQRPGLMPPSPPRPAYGQLGAPSPLPQQPT